jgi:flavin-dependent dehydrogenase
MPESVKRWDALIVGGGVAGGAAAALLAQKGRKVLLLEKEKDAHDKVCGEFLSSEAQYYLRELGLDLSALGAEPVTSIRLMRGQKIASAALPFRAASLSRRVLDETMLLRAQAEGAQVWRGATVTKIAQKPQGWRIEVSGQDALTAETVFLATGKHELRDWHRSSGLQNDFIGFKLHFRLTLQQRVSLAGLVEITLFDGGYAGLEPVEEGKANLCLVVTKRQFAKYEKNWDSLLNAILKATPALAGRLAGAEACWPRPLSIFGVPYGFIYSAPSNAAPSLYRLGDQMAVIPSFSGYGISIALYSAFLAVECYLHRDLKTYHRQARCDLLPLLRRSFFLSKLAEYPLAQQAIMLLCRITPALLTIMATHNRIGILPNDLIPPASERPDPTEGKNIF